MTSLGGIVNIFSEIKKYEEDTLFAGKAVEQMTKAFGNMNVDDAIKAFRGLGIEGEDLVEILLDCGVKSEVVEASLKKVGKTGTSFVGKLKSGFEGLAGTLGMTASGLSKLLIGLAIPAAVIAGIKAYNAYINECVQNAKSAGDAWSSSSKSIDAQVSRLKEIDETLKSGNLTEEESYAIKTELYSIQQDIVDSYGKQAAGIDLVNGKLEEEISLLQKINEENADQFLNENEVGINKAAKEIEKNRSYFVGTFGTFGDDSKAIDSLIEKYGEYFTVTRDLYGSQKSVYFKGTAEEATEILNKFATDLRDMKSDFNLDGFADGLLKGVSKGLNKAKGTLDEYQDLYNQARRATLVSDNTTYTINNKDKTALEFITEYEEAIEKYNIALESGDPSKIEETSKALKEARDAMDVESKDGTSAYSLYSKEVDELTEKINQAKKAQYEFRRAIDGDNSVFGKDIRHYAYQLKNLGLDDIDLKNMLKTDEVDESGERQFRALMDAAYECGLISSKTVDDIQPLIDILIELGYVVGETASQTQDASNQAAKSYEDIAKSVSGLKSELGAINGALSEQGYSGNLSVDTYDSLIAISKDYAACVEYQNGALQLNAEKANMLFEAKSELMKADLELQKLTEAAKWKENADEIARLTKQYDGLDSAISDKIKSLEKENDGIEANLVGYDLQIAAIEELTSAYGRWKAASESDNSDSMYKDIQKAYEQIKEAQKTGQTGVGNVVYQAAVELLVPDGEDVKKYMGTLKRYITDGSSGLTNFINDMVSKGLMERSKTDWNKVSMVAGTTMQEIMDKMTLTPDMAKSIFNALEMYDFDFHWTDEDFNINTDDAMAELKAAQEEMNNTIATINKMKEAGATVDFATGLSRDDLEKKLAEQKSQVDKLMNSVTGDPSENTVEYTVTANTKEADTALDTIKERLEDILAKIQSISEKKMGDLGGGATKSILDRVHSRLIDIANFKIADKTFNIIPKLSNTTSTDSSGQTSGTLVPGNNIFGSLLPQDIGFFASGTKQAPDGPAILGDEYSPDGSPKPELVITDGSAYIAGQDGPELVNLNHGDQVIPADETEKILQRNPDVKKNVVPAFATGAGGYPAGSVQEDKYLEGAIGPDPTWLKQREEQKKKDDELIKQLSAKAAEKSADDGYLNYVAKNQIAISSDWTKSTGTKISGDGDQSSLKNSGGGGSGGGSGGSSSSNSSDSSKKEKSRFEKDYELKNHYLNMEKMDYEEYIDWLEDAYKEAYEKGEIELEDYYKYAEEVFNGQKELFQDSIEDIEHKIKGLEREPGNEQQIVNYYNQIIQKIDAEIADARARGLNDDDDYIQELLEQKWGYADEIKDIQDEITENAKDAVEDLIDYRMDMLKQDLENERDAIGDKLDTLRDFYDKQKEMLQDVYDEEKYLEEQSEKRKSVDDIKAEIDMLRFDDSAKAQKRIKELQEELKDAEKELSDFEKDHALESATDLLDKMYEQQESQMQSEMDALEERLNDPNALYNQALRDIQNNTLALYEEMIKYNNKYGSGNPDDIFNMWSEADKSLDAYFKAMGESYKNILLVDAYKPTGYASGTSHATPGVHELFEGNKDEYVYTTKDGKRYRMFSGLGDKVLNASATDFLYKFANNGETFISNMLNGLVSAIGNVGKPAQQIQLSTGDIVVQGNATAETVSAIRRAQRENIDFVLREFTRLNR